MKSFKITLAIALAMAFGLTSMAQQVMPTPLDPNVRTGKLDNGLTYFIRHNEKQPNAPTSTSRRKLVPFLKKKPNAVSPTSWSTWPSTAWSTSPRKPCLTTWSAMA